MPIDHGTLLDGRYRILSLLGRGGMGAVHLAENVRVKKQVAVKVLHRSVAASPEILQRFENEAQAAAKVGSEHVCQVFDFGITDEGDHYMVMELLEGETLKQRIRREGKLTPEQSVTIFEQMLEGLAAAHAAGIVHRDLKPDNIFLQREVAGHRDWVKILDFGISKFNALTGDEGSLTQSGVVMGTPFFMSPEQAKSAHLADARSDLYSVAAMLFQVLTGDVPFRAGTLTEMLFKVAYDPTPNPRERNPLLSEAVCAVLVRGMSREPGGRFQSAKEMREALSRAVREGVAPASTQPADGAKAAAGAGQVTPPPPPSAGEVTTPAVPRRVPKTEPLPPALQPDSRDAQAGSVAAVGPPDTDSSGPVRHESAPGLTQRTWNGSPLDTTPPAKSKKGLAVGVALALGVTAMVAFSVGAGSGASPDAAKAPAGAGGSPTLMVVSAAPGAALVTPSAEPVGAGAPTSAGSLAASATASAAAPDTSATPSRVRPKAPVAPAAAAPKAAPKPAATGSRVVTDLGY
jgi:serine/threonine protein kinase